MEISDYLRILNRRKWVILATTIVTFAVAVFGRAQMPVKYDAIAVIRVIPYTNANPSFTQLAYADRIMKTYVEIGSGSVVMSSLRDEMGLTTDQPLGVVISIIPETELLQITVSDDDPALASEVANALATYLANDKSIRDVRLTLLEPATVPEPPSMLVTILFFALAAVAGMVGGLGLAFLFESVDTRLHEERQLEKLSTLPILGQIPSVSRRYSHKIITTKYPYNHSFRRLVANLLTIANDRELHTIMVTSPEPDEGKSTVAMNLAYSLAQAGHKTLLVDIDVYRPTLYHYFGIPNEPGLSNLLMLTDSRENVIRTTNLSTLWVIPSGKSPEHSEDIMMNGERLAGIIGDRVGEYKFVIFDSPAFLAVADSLMLSRLVDGVMVVVKLGSTRLPAFKITCQQMSSVQANLIGLVVNAVEDGHFAAYSQPKKEFHFTKLLQTIWRLANTATKKVIIEPMRLRSLNLQNKKSMSLDEKNLAVDEKVQLLAEKSQIFQPLYGITRLPDEKAQPLAEILPTPQLPDEKTRLSDEKVQQSEENSEISQLPDEKPRLSDEKGHLSQESFQISQPLYGITRLSDEKVQQSEENSEISQLPDEKPRFSDEKDQLSQESIQISQPLYGITRLSDEKVQTLEEKSQISQLPDEKPRFSDEKDQLSQESIQITQPLYGITRLSDEKVQTLEEKSQTSQLPDEKPRLSDEKVQQSQENSQITQLQDEITLLPDGIVQQSEEKPQFSQSTKDKARLSVKKPRNSGRKPRISREEINLMDEQSLTSTEVSKSSQPTKDKDQKSVKNPGTADKKSELVQLIAKLKAEETMSTDEKAQLSIKESQDSQPPFISDQKVINYSEPVDRELQLARLIARLKGENSQTSDKTSHTPDEKSQSPRMIIEPAKPGNHRSVKVSKTL